LFPSKSEHLVILSKQRPMGKSVAAALRRLTPPQKAMGMKVSRDP